MSEGLLYLYDDETEGEIEIPVTFEYDYQPEEAQTLNYPGCPEDVSILSVTAAFGDVDVDKIQNLEESEIDLLDCIHNQREPDVEPINCVVIDLDI